MAEGSPRQAPNPHAPHGTGAAVERLEPTQWATKAQIFYARRATTTNAFGFSRQLIASTGLSCEPSMWSATVVARELFHAAAAGTPVTSPANILSTGRDTSQLQCELEWSTGALVSNTYQLDIGAGFTWSWWGTVPKFQILIPNGGFIVTSPDQIQTDPGGTGVNETMVGFAVNKVRTWSARSVYQNTFSISVPGNTSVFIPVPYGAQSVEVFQDSVGAATASVQFSDGSAFAMAQLDFEPGLRRTGRHRIPGNAPFIQTSPTLAGVRQMTAVFEMEP
jgi:hypothetical protein